MPAALKTVAIAWEDKALGQAGSQLEARRVRHAAFTSRVRAAISETALAIDASRASGP